MTDAIQQDVSTEEQGAPLTAEEVQKGNEAALRAEIYDRSNTVRESVAEKFERERAERLGLPVEEKADDGDEGDEGAPPVAAQPEPVREERREAPPAPPAPREDGDLPVYRNAKGEFVTKLRVNGVDQEVPYERVKATMQKHLAADQRLQYASDLVRKAEERAAAIEERERRLRESAQPPRGVVTDEEAEREAKAIIDKLLDGEADEAAKELAKAMRRGTAVAPTPDLHEIEEKAAQRALRKIEETEYQKDLGRGTQRFSETFPEIVNDPDLFTLANQKTIELQREKPYLSPSEILMEAGEYVASRFVRPSGRQPAGTPASTAPSRQQRKDNLKPMPKPATARTARPVPAPIPTKEDWLAEQRRLRGQR